MNLIEVFKSPFTLVNSHTFYDPTPTIRFEFKTDDIYDTTTKEEIFIICKMYLDNIILQYKNYIINGEPTTESTYKLYVGIWKDDELEFKHIYSIFYDNESDRISWENKYDDNIAIEGKFFMGIDVSVYVIQDYENEEDSEEEEEYKIKQSIPENECVICYENKANIPYTECLHYAVCDSCDKAGKFSKCPLCRQKIKNQRIKIN